MRILLPESEVLATLVARLPEKWRGQEPRAFLPPQLMPLANARDGRNWTVLWWLRSRPVPELIERLIAAAADEVARKYNVDWWG